LDALRKYSEGVRAGDAEEDYVRATRLYREAVALDSNFAEGWRKLAAAIYNTGAYAPAAMDSALTRAYQLRDRMSERERDAVIAFYYEGSPGYDRVKAVAAYERMLARGDSEIALHDLGNVHRSRREFAIAESLYRAGAAVEPSKPSGFWSLTDVLLSQGKWAQADSVASDATKRFPGSLSASINAIERLNLDGRFDAVAHALDSARKKGEPRRPSWAARAASGNAANVGRLRVSRELARQARVIDSAASAQVPEVLFLGGALNDAIEAHAPFDAQLKAFDDAVDRAKIDDWPIKDRPYLYVAELNAKAGRPDRARAWIARFDAAVRDTVLRRWETPDREHAEGHLAISERRWKDAADLLRKADRRPDGPVNECAECLPMDLISLFATANMPDSALAVYASYRQTPLGSRPRHGPDANTGAARTEALAKMFDAKGDTANAVAQYRDFIEFWKNADPELQPRVAAARERLAQLTPVERPRR
jgi:tetratricopeptide (TPR) repeat protein